MKRIYFYRIGDFGERIGQASCLTSEARCLGYYRETPAFAGVTGKVQE